jgi:cytochrome c553
MKSTIPLIIGILSLSSAGAMAGDVAAGQAAFTTKGCIGCHGAGGVSVDPAYPTLRGKEVAFVEKNLRDFKNGKRIHAIKNALAMGLSDADIANLAAYIGSLSK